MSYPNCLVSEEPLQPNFDVDVLNEDSGVLELANFSLNRLNRYLLTWERGHRLLQEESIETFETLMKLLSMPCRVVLGWRDEAGDIMRMRRRHLRSRLSKSGWQLVVDEPLGVAMLEISPYDLARAIQPVVGWPEVGCGVGWFLLLGRQIPTSALVHAPFRNTMKVFCESPYMAPSTQFLEALADSSSGIAFTESRADHLPRVQLVISKPVGSLIREHFDIPACGGIKEAKKC